MIDPEDDETADAIVDAVRRMAIRARELGPGWYGEPVLRDGDRVATLVVRVERGRAHDVVHVLEPGDTDNGVECRACGWCLASCRCQRFPA